MFIFLKITLHILTDFYIQRYIAQMTMKPARDREKNIINYGIKRSVRVKLFTRSLTMIAEGHTHGLFAYGIEQAENTMKKVNDYLFWWNFYVVPLGLCVCVHVSVL